MISASRNKIYWLARDAFPFLWYDSEAEKRLRIRKELIQKMQLLNNNFTKFGASLEEASNALKMLGQAGVPMPKWDNDPENNR